MITAGGAADRSSRRSACCPGNRIVFAGSGPLALAFPAQLRGLRRERDASCSRRARPRAPATSSGSLGAARGNTGCFATPSPTARALLRARVPLRYGRIVVRAEGDGRVEQRRPRGRRRRLAPVAGTEETVEADTLCVGYGFFPSVELLRLAGCDFALRRGPRRAGRRPRRVAPHDGAAASRPPATAPASPARYVAVDEGRLAALGAALDLGALTRRRGGRQAEPIRARPRPQARRSAAALRRLHAVGAGHLRARDADDTVVCRCEEVTPASWTRRSRDHGRPERREEPHPRRRWGSARAETASARSPRRSPGPARHSDRVRPVGDAALPGAAGADRRRSPTRSIEDDGLFFVDERARTSRRRAAGCRRAPRPLPRAPTCSSSAAASPARRSRTTSPSRASRSCSSSAAS